MKKTITILMRDVEHLSRQLKRLEGRTDDASMHQRWQLSRDWDAAKAALLGAVRASGTRKGKPS